MLSQGGVSNARIQLGDIIRSSDNSKIPQVIENISKRHQFLFRDEGIICQNLPDFANGIKVTAKQLETGFIKDMPKYKASVLNHDTFKYRPRELVKEGNSLEGKDILHLDSFKS